MDSSTGPIEVWLTQKNMRITCMIASDDESTRTLPIRSLSVRGAQREITTRLATENYHPAGRWVTETPGETTRRFRNGE